MLKSVLVRLSLLAPFALAAVLCLRCIKMEPKLETDWVFKDTTGNFEIPAHGYMFFKAEVTPEMFEVKDHKQVYLDCGAWLMSPVNDFRLTAYLMDEENLFSFQVNGPFEPFRADSSHSVVDAAGFVDQPCVMYGVVSNRADSMPKRVRVGYLIQHWTMVPK